MSVSTKKARKPSKADQITHYTERNHKDLSTYEISCRLNTVCTNIKDLEGQIHELLSRVATFRTRLAVDRAEALGLENLLDSRR